MNIAYYIFYFLNILSKIKNDKFAKIHALSFLEKVP